MALMEDPVAEIWAVQDSRLIRDSADYEGVQYLDPFMAEVAHQQLDGNLLHTRNRIQILTGQKLLAVGASRDAAAGNGMIVMPRYIKVVQQLLDAGVKTDVVTLLLTAGRLDSTYKKAERGHSIQEMLQANKDAIVAIGWRALR
jgi:hypothetical protein